MKPSLNLKVVAMMAACAVTATVGTARAEGMPESAQQLVQTMRPMQPHNGAPEQDASAQSRASDDRAYGGATGNAGTSASGRSADCAWAPACTVFFGH
ncbi:MULTISPECIES: hypothetical protein [unclassified Caballeronia]|uniref:hypothetical protein n=1 Tax=unclassified Caballeronia TaxID=2646786 RepID=UPI002864404C|nr:MULTISPECIES: hypothetical protein [unclassified Caballeronia]MDR5740765.1 hypothetical protein [Caballeronia sp. LZ016]MDR5808713.1 hypothetical protein [Caballeronia sp. LZ019]